MLALFAGSLATLQLLNGTLLPLTARETFVNPSVKICGKNNRFHQPS
jgi:hypothetical protein